MASIKKFVFGPFQENTYVLYDTSGECWIVDPGCYFPEESRQLEKFINNNGLRPTRLLNTHCHIDHIFGNSFVHSAFGLRPEYHVLDQPTLDMGPRAANLYGLSGFEPSPNAQTYLIEGSVLELGESRFEVLFVPGHCPGHVAFVNRLEAFIVGGDVLFRGSIGRTDLPGGDSEELMESIRLKFLTLPADYIVYSGHGPETRIGEEKKFNPFLLHLNPDRK
jgi:hydroxyacylglutathione hydrolase